MERDKNLSSEDLYPLKPSQKIRCRFGSRSSILRASWSKELVSSQSEEPKACEPVLNAAFAKSVPRSSSESDVSRSRTSWGDAVSRRILCLLPQPFGEILQSIAWGSDPYRSSRIACTAFIHAGASLSTSAIGRAWATSSSYLFCSRVFIPFTIIPFAYCISVASI
jgi:hypothetical protein